MWRYLNMFVLIGVALLIISAIGFATGNRFLAEPGQPLPDPALERRKTRFAVVSLG